MTFPGLSAARRRTLLEPPSGPVRVVIDTDAKNEIDDQFALAYALLSPERLRIEGVYAAPYCFEILRERIVREHVARGGRAEEVNLSGPARGMEKSYQEILRVYEAFGSDPGGRVQRGSDRYLPAADQPVASPATEHLIQLALAERDEPLYVLAIGCATNVASALLLAPEIAQRLVVIWDAAYPSSFTRPNASFNMEQDMRASQLLFESGVPLVYVPGYYIAEQLRLSLPEVREYVRGRGRLGEFLYELYAGWPLLGDHYARSWIMWDIANVAWLVNPDWLPSELTTAPRLCDDKRWEIPTGMRHQMREAWGLDRDAIFGDFFRKLEKHPDAG